MGGWDIKNHPQSIPTWFYLSLFGTPQTSQWPILRILSKKRFRDARRLLCCNTRDVLCCNTRDVLCCNTKDVLCCNTRDVLLGGHFLTMSGSLFHIFCVMLGYVWGRFGNVFGWVWDSFEDKFRKFRKVEIFKNAREYLSRVGHEKLSILSLLPDQNIKKNEISATAMGASVLDSIQAIGW